MKTIKGRDRRNRYRHAYKEIPERRRKIITENKDEDVEERDANGGKER